MQHKLDRIRIGNDELNFSPIVLISKAVFTFSCDYILSFYYILEYTNLKAHCAAFVGY